MTIHDPDCGQRAGLCRHGVEWKPGPLDTGQLAERAYLRARYPELADAVDTIEAAGVMLSAAIDRDAEQTRTAAEPPGITHYRSWGINATVR